MRVIWLLCVLFMVSSQAAAQLTIEVTRGMDQPTRIAVVPFIWSSPGTAPHSLDQIVRDDLRRSGFFDTMEPRNMLSFPTPGPNINFRDWRITDTEYLLVGSVTLDASGYQVFFELYDVVTERLVLGRTVSGGPTNARDVAHRISDIVYENLTGIRGVFSTRILYVTDNRQGNEVSQYQLMLADQDGARERVVLTSPQPLMSPTWSPDGTQVAYVSFETGRAAIFRQNLATGVREQLTNFERINGAPAFSPDGTKLAMVLSKDGNPEIYVMDLLTKELTRITEHFAIDTEPNWTPDGRSLVFTSDRGGRPQIYRVDIDSRRVVRLTFRGDYNARPRLSTDGRFLVMVHQSEGVFHIAVQDMIDSTFLIVTETELDESPTIAPNGAMVMYATKWQNRSILAAVSLDAGIRYRLPAQTADVREPAWSPF